MTDLGGLFDEHGVGVLSGVLGTMLIKEMTGRFLRRSERLEAKAEDRHNGTIERLLSEVELVRRSLDVWGERWTHAQKEAGETKQRVDNHDCRISALEAGHADLRARFETINEAKDD